MEIELLALIEPGAILCGRHFFRFLKPSFELPYARKSADRSDFPHFQFGMFFHDFTSAFYMFFRKVFGHSFSETLFEEFMHIDVADADLSRDFACRQPRARIFRQINRFFYVQIPPVRLFIVVMAVDNLEKNGLHHTVDDGIIGVTIPKSSYSLKTAFPSRKSC